MPECFAMRAPALYADRAVSGIQFRDLLVTLIVFWIPVKGARE
jgi:hypothetical protein